MKFVLFALVIAIFALSTSALVPLKSVIISFPDSTPDRVVTEAKTVIKAAVSTSSILSTTFPNLLLQGRYHHSRIQYVPPIPAFIMQYTNLSQNSSSMAIFPQPAADHLSRAPTNYALRGFAAKVNSKAISAIQTMDQQYNALIEEDIVVHATDSS